VETKLFVLGDVYRLSDVADPVRVIAFDPHVVMYDTWWPEKSAWSMARLSGQYAYYRLPSDYFARHTSAYFSPSWTAFQADRGRDFSVIVDGISN
jgi:hypothetical protein